MNRETLEETCMRDLSPLILVCPIFLFLLPHSFLPFPLTRSDSLPFFLIPRKSTKH